MDSLICNGGFSDTIIEILTIIGWFIFGYGVMLIVCNISYLAKWVKRAIKGIKREKREDEDWLDYWQPYYGWFHCVKLSIIISTVVYGVFLIVSAV